MPYSIAAHADTGHHERPQRLGDGGGQGVHQQAPQRAGGDDKGGGLQPTARDPRARRWAPLRRRGVKRERVRGEVLTGGGEDAGA